MDTLPWSKSCFVCGAENRSGLQLKFETDGNSVRARWLPREEYNGFKNVIHGGITATLLDEIMVWACGVRTGKFAYCAELNIRYNLPIRPGIPVIATALLVEDKRRVLLASGEVRDEAGALLASGTGKYIPVRDMDYSTLLADFVGSPEELKRLFPGHY